MAVLMMQGGRLHLRCELRMYEAVSPVDSSYERYDVKFIRKEERCGRHRRVMI